MPERIQQRRSKGWRMPDNAQSVARPSKWGNPYKVELAGRHAAVGYFRLYAIQVLGVEQIQDELAGRDLACWCPLVDSDGQPVPCHADVLLELANREES